VDGVDGEARVVWSDGWRDIIRKEGDDFRKIAFAPGNGFDDKVDNTASARRLKAASKVTLKVGWGRADITPNRPVGLIGFGRRRISEGAKDPITATVLALEGVDEKGKVVEQAMLISCDLIVNWRRKTGKKIQLMPGYPKAGEHDEHKEVIPARYNEETHSNLRSNRVTTPTTGT